MGQDPALEVPPKFALYKHRKPFGFDATLGEEGFQMTGDRLMHDGLLGAAADP